MAAAETTPALLAESLLAFWADGGVDAMLLDKPLDRIEAGRIAPPHRPGPAASTPPRGRVNPPLHDVAAAVAQARAAAQATANLEALVAAITAFEGCPIRFEGAATQPVVWRGDLAAPVMVIGEAPGAEEDAAGAPFQGRAGKMLDRMLGAAGLDGRVFMTNTVFWRPRGDRPPTSAEQAVCGPFVERMIELLRPRLLLLVGGLSAKAMLRRDDGIVKLRGCWVEWTSEDGSQALPALTTLNPAFLLRQPAAKKDAWNDILALTERLDPPA